MIDSKINKALRRFACLSFGRRQEWVVTSNFSSHGMETCSEARPEVTRVHHEEHEGHEEWHSVQAAAGGVNPAEVKTGLLMNFNVTKLKSGIKRFIL